LQVSEVRLFGRKLPLVKLEEGEEAVVVSDTHFGLNHQGLFVTRFRELESFFKHLAEGRRPSLVVLLGDIFEFWTARVRDIVSTALAPLRRLAELDTLVAYVVGNHDRVVAHLGRDGMFVSENVLVVPEMMVVECGGRKGLLLHGHQLDWKFTKLKGLWRIESSLYLLTESLSTLPGSLEWVLAATYAAITPVMLYLTEGAPFAYRVFAMMSAILLSAPLLMLTLRITQGKLWYGLIQPVADVLLKGRLRGRAFSSAAVNRPLERLLSEMEAAGLGRLDFVVFGHTHVPELAVNGEGRVIANSGSWVAEPGVPCCTLIRLRRGRITLARWSGNGEEVLAEHSF